MAKSFTLARLIIIVVIFTIAQAMSALTTEQPPPPPTTEPQLPPDSTRMTTPMMTTHPKCPSNVNCPIVPRCVDPVLMPDCCKGCPNGRQNCKLPSGKVIRAGVNVTYNGVQCRCPKDQHHEWQPDPTKAECDKYTTTTATTTTTTTPPRGCQLANGTFLKDLEPGDEYKPDPCTFCTCEDDFKMKCVVAGCPRPPCDDPVTPEGECCPQCPPCEDSSNQCRYWAYNAECQKNPVWMRENCKKSCAVCDAECVDTDQHCKWWSEQGYCDSNPVWMKENCPVSCDACTPRTTTLAPPSTTTPAPFTTPPPGCFGRDWYLGQQTFFPEPGACHVCTCGDSACAIGDCAVPMCVDASRSSGACCLTCPNGPNCRIRWTGEVITLPVFRNFTSNEGNHFMRCECPPQSYAMPGVQWPEHYTAVCKEVATTTPPLV